VAKEEVKWQEAQRAFEKQRTQEILETQAHQEWQTHYELAQREKLRKTAEKREKQQRVAAYLKTSALAVPEDGHPIRCSKNKKKLPPKEELPEDGTTQAILRLQKQEQILRGQYKKVAKQIIKISAKAGEEKGKRRRIGDGERQSGHFLRENGKLRIKQEIGETETSSDSEEERETFSALSRATEAQETATDDSEDDRVSCSVQGHGHARAVRQGRRKKLMTLDRYEGGDWEMYMIHFETVSQHNEWNEADKLAYLKGAMKGTTLRLLKGRKVWTFDSLCKEMASQYGTGGNTRQFENDLRVRKRGVSETLDEYYREKHSLLMRAYPD